jgi:hypothetical protein
MAMSCAVTMVLGEGVACDFSSTVFVSIMFWVQYNYQWPIYNYHCDRFVHCGHVARWGQKLKMIQRHSGKTILIYV